MFTNNLTCTYFSLDREISTRIPIIIFYTGDTSFPPHRHTHPIYHYSQSFFLSSRFYTADAGSPPRVRRANAVASNTETRPTANHRAMWEIPLTPNGPAR